jgi:ketosteroid isomerase-like protein
VVKVGTANGPNASEQSGGAILFATENTVKTITVKRIAIISIMLLSSFCLKAQTQKLVDKELFNTIYQLDSSWFAAFNEKDLKEFAKYMDTTLEFFHDRTGLTDYKHNINAFTSIMKNVPDLTRTLIKEIMEVYPVPNYGAVQIAQHRFCHMENGKMDCGVFKFIHVWKKTSDGWKVTRIISVDH